MKDQTPGRPSRARVTIILLLTLCMVFPLWIRPAQAAIPKLEHIRVALFISDRTVVPSVTLSAPDEMQLGLRQPAGVRTWLSMPAQQQVRFSVDQYMIFIHESSDYHLAVQLAAQVNEWVGEAYVFRSVRQGEVRYRVYAGQFSNEQLAASTKARLEQQVFLQPYSLELVGPYHLNAGTFSTEEAAKSHLNQLRNNGLYANVAYHENAEGSLVYSVWVGEESNQAALDQLRTLALQAMPGLTLQAVDYSKPYLLLKEQVGFAGSSTELPHFYFNQSGQHVLVTTTGTSLLVKERSNRTYRGSIELTQRQGHLAVVNELPFEHYLYSVVGSELDSSFPSEALKAQAVAARTFALSIGMKYGIAHVSDTTYEQAYYGVAAEFPAAIESVQATANEVMLDRNGNVIEAFYHSNAGGITADTSEIWGTPLEYIQSVPSPDRLAEERVLPWYRVILQSGQVGYVRSDFTVKTNHRTDAGLNYMLADGSDVNVRQAPYVNNNTNPAIAQINYGDRLILIDEAAESNAYSWIRGPYSAEQMKSIIQRNNGIVINGKLERLEVAERGPSGRVLEVLANQQTIQVNTPDGYRSVLNELPSTRFEIEETGRYTVLGANGTRQFPEQGGPLYALQGSEGAGDSAVSSVAMSEFLLLDSKQKIRLVTLEPEYRFIGQGFGHGIGMSQWGARELAEFMGYDYQQILKYYYQGIQIVKG